jgi:hypothetical protein
MRPELLAFWNEAGEVFERHLTAKSSAEMLLAKVTRYEAALLRIAKKADEQKALMEHREKTG